MPWVRFDDRAIDHPKFLELSAQAFRLWFEGMCYCNKHLTDGLISKRALVGFRYGTKSRIGELLKMTLWERHDVGFKIHDYLEWNENRESVLLSREQARRRRSAYRSPDGTASRLCGVVSTSSSSEILQEEKRTELPPLFHEFWRLYPRKVGRADALKTWLKLKPSGDLVAQMLATLAWQKQQEAWVKDGGQYVPNPATWLNQGRWDDEPTASPLTRVYEPWVCPHEPPCKHRPACDFISMRKRA